MANRPKRLTGFSYIGAYLYFLTICTNRRQKCFEDESSATWMTEQIAEIFEARTRERLWQERYYEHVVREDDPVIGIVRYILNNPFRAGLVADGTAYPFSGSSRFTQEELRDALIDWRPP